MIFRFAEKPKHVDLRQRGQWSMKEMNIDAATQHAP
jgi:hypothetical protein